MPDWTALARHVTEAQAAFRAAAQDHRWPQRSSDRDRFEAARAALHRAGESFDANLWPLFEGLRKGDSNCVRLALDYLESAPRCFGSGYRAEELLRGLRQVHLDEKAVRRLRSLILDWIPGSHGREFNALAGLAPRIATPEFVREVIDLGTGMGGKSGRRAQRVLVVLRSAGWSSWLDEEGYRHR